MHNKGIYKTYFLFGFIPVWRTKDLNYDTEGSFQAEAPKTFRKKINIKVDTPPLNSPISDKLIEEIIVGINKAGDRNIFLSGPEWADTFCYNKEAARLSSDNWVFLDESEFTPEEIGAIRMITRSEKNGFMSKEEANKARLEVIKHSKKSKESAAETPQKYSGMVTGIHGYYSHKAIRGYVTEDNFKKIKVLDILEAQSVLTPQEAQEQRIAIVIAQRKEVRDKLLAYWNDPTLGEPFDVVTKENIDTITEAMDNIKPGDIHDNNPQILTNIRRPEYDLNMYYGERPKCTRERMFEINEEILFVYTTFNSEKPFDVATKKIRYINSDKLAPVHNFSYGTTEKVFFNPWHIFPNDSAGLADAEAFAHNLNFKYGKGK